MTIYRPGEMHKNVYNKNAMYKYKNEISIDGVSHILHYIK